MNNHRVLAAFLLLAPGVALAQSEGVATFKLESLGDRDAGGTGPLGTGTLAFSKTAIRMDMQMDLSGVSHRRGTDRADVPSAVTFSTITKLAEPDKVYMVNDRQKTYSVIDYAKNRPETKTDEKWTVQRTGRDSVAGVTCEKATITSSKGTKVEACVASDLLGSSAWWNAMNRRQGGNELWVRALADAGLKGFPVRMKYTTAAGRGSIEMALVSLDRHGVPASTFEIPASYKETSAAMVAMSPEQQKMMSDALAKMTPQQRKAYEDAMKKAQ